MSRLQALYADAGQAIRRFGKDRSGATAIEYAMIAVFISVVILAAVNSIGLSVKGGFTDVANGLK